MTNFKKVNIEDESSGLTSNIHTLADSIGNLDGTNGQVVAAALFGRVSDTVLAPLQLDDSTNSIQTVSYAHHEIHGGSAYVVSMIFNSVGSGSSADVLIVTPDTTKYTHMVYSAVGTGEFEALMYEDTTTSADGTAITPTNRNRNSANTPGAVATHTPTITGVGTLLLSSRLGSGKNSGGESRDISEFILKRNTKYLFRITSRAAGNELTHILDWYEHTDRN